MFSVSSILYAPGQEAVNTGAQAKVACFLFASVLVTLCTQIH